MTPEKQQSPFSRVAGRAAQGPWPEALLTLAASASFPRRLEKVTVTAAVVQPLSRVRPFAPSLVCLFDLFVSDSLITSRGPAFLASFQVVLSLGV